MKSIDVVRLDPSGDFSLLTIHGDALDGIAAAIGSPMYSMEVVPHVRAWLSFGATEVNQPATWLIGGALKRFPDPPLHGGVIFAGQYGDDVVSLPAKSRACIRVCVDLVYGDPAMMALLTDVPEDAQLLNDRLTELLEKMPLLEL